MTFRAPIRVCFSDIDNAGIVYYPRFVHYFHLAMEGFFADELGIDYADVLHERKLAFPTVHLESDFRRRMKYRDQIDMEVRILHVGKTSIKWGYRGFQRGKKTIWWLKVIISRFVFTRKPLKKWISRNGYVRG